MTNFKKEYPNTYMQIFNLVNDLKNKDLSISFLNKSCKGTASIACFGKSQLRVHKERGGTLVNLPNGGNIFSYSPDFSYAIREKAATIVQILEKHYRL